MHKIIDKYTTYLQCTSKLLVQTVKWDRTYSYLSFRVIHGCKWRSAAGICEYEEEYVYNKVLNKLSLFLLTYRIFVSQNT